MSLKVKNKDKKKILIIEDDCNLSRVVEKFYAKTDLFETRIARSKEVVKQLVKNEAYDLITLDIVLKDGNGLELIPFFNKNQLTSKIIVLTKKEESKIKRMVFRLGVDDYMSKPFDLNELVCRTKKLLHIDQVSSSEEILVYNDWIKLNPLKRELIIESYRIKLSGLEYIIFECFLQHDGFVKRDLLIKSLRARYDSNFRDNSLNVALTRLRKKLYAVTGMRLIKNKYGVGYYINGLVEF